MVLLAKFFASSACDTRIFPVSQSKEIRHSAIGFLSRREYTSKELLGRLSKKFSDPDEIEKQIQKLAEEGLQCDRRFACVFLRSQISKFRGPIRVRSEMKMRGLSDDCIEYAFNEEQTEWMELLFTLNERKYCSTPFADLNEKAKRARFFQYRGFSIDQINEVLD